MYLIDTGYLKENAQKNIKYWFVDLKENLTI